MAHRDDDDSPAKRPDEEAGAGKDAAGEADHAPKVGLEDVSKLSPEHAPEDAGS